MPDPRPCARCKTAPRASNATYCNPCKAQIRFERRPPERQLPVDSRPCARCKIAARSARGHSYCRPCSNERQRERQERQLPCGRCGIEPSVLKSHYCYSCGRDMWLRRAYGISLVEYTSMVAAQSGLCASCGRPPRRETLDVDHCHDTGRVRGLLCNRCNRGLGVFEDSPERLRLAADYLERTA